MFTTKALKSTVIPYFDLLINNRVFNTSQDCEISHCMCLKGLFLQMELSTLEKHPSFLNSSFISFSFFFNCPSVFLSLWVYFVFFQAKKIFKT